jgi:hypothetical protein
VLDLHSNGGPAKSGQLAARPLENDLGIYPTSGWEFGVGFEIVVQLRKDKRGNSAKADLRARARSFGEYWETRLDHVVRSWEGETCRGVGSHPNERSTGSVAREPRS